MKMYSAHGVNDFIVCCGYKGYIIKEYFANYFLHQSDVTFDMNTNSMEAHQERVEPWTITVVDTGDNSMTGVRLGRVSEYIKGENAFCFTYGDGVSDVDISKLIAFHKEHGKDATLTAVYPPGRFGALDIQENKVKQFTEKPKGDGALINGGFFALSPKVLNVFEHFYDDSIYQNVSTHYVNLAYEIEIEEASNLPTEQHNEYQWLTIDELLKNNQVHKYVKNYFRS